MMEAAAEVEAGVGLGSNSPLLPKSVEELRYEKDIHRFKKNSHGLAATIQGVCMFVCVVAAAGDHEKDLYIYTSSAVALLLNAIPSVSYTLINYGEEKENGKTYKNMELVTQMTQAMFLVASILFLVVTHSNEWRDSAAYVLGVTAGSVATSAVFGVSESLFPCFFSKPARAQAQPSVNGDSDGAGMVKGGLVPGLRPYGSI